MCERQSTHVPVSFPSEEQRAVIEHLSGPVLVLAPVGTGKTQTMAARLQNCIQSGIDPERTLCITFTNRAAREVKARVEAALGEEAHRVMVSTFHGLCAWILRCEASNIGFPMEFTIYDEADCRDLLDEIIESMGTAIQKDLRSRYERSIHNDSPALALYNELATLKTEAASSDLAIEYNPRLFSNLPRTLQRVSEEYHYVLHKRSAMDFADLIHRVRALLTHFPDRGTFWHNRFDWIQVDEVQDTHLSEYDVVAKLGLRTKNVAFFGDLYQSIYEWRGAEPKAVLEAFRRDFGEPSRFLLSTNYRSSPALLEAARRFLTLVDRVSPHRWPRATATDTDSPITVKHFPKASDEAAWIASCIRELVSDRTDQVMRVAVLARTRTRAKYISEELRRAGVEHVSFDNFDFFRRQEVKDVVARLRLIVNPDDLDAFQRLVARPPMRVGENTMRKLLRECSDAYLRPTDLVRLRTHQTGDPFSLLLQAWESNRVVVLDVETTGLVPGRDQAVEIAAIRTGLKGSEVLVHRYIRPTVSVGDSKRIHGYSDAFLQEAGNDAHLVFAELASFLQGVHLVGHNIQFDLAIIRSHSNSVGIELDTSLWDDTLGLAKRVIKAERYSLDVLARQLGLRCGSRHHALADAEITAQLLERIIRELKLTCLKREALVRQYAHIFKPLSLKLEQWRSDCDRLQVSDLLEKIIRESGLEQYYSREPERLRNLAELVAFVRYSEKPSEVTSMDRVRHFLATAALARNADHIDPTDNRPIVLTVHQAKGMEFDTVFVPGSVEDEFPHYWSVKEGRLEEEQRLFYVAITRARLKLVLTSHSENEQGWRRTPSRFLRAIM